MIDAEDNTYTVQLTTTASFKEAIKRLKLFDETVEGILLFDRAGKVTIEVMVDEDSILSQEVLSWLAEGQIPDALIGFKINKPGVYRVKQLDLWGEELDKLRGISEYKTYEYLPNIPQTIVRVWVLDTGVDMTHPDLRDRISTTVPGYDFYNDDTDPTDDQGHGTHVAGTIAWSINGQGIIGVNPYVEIVPIKICGESGFCPTYEMNKGIKYAIDQGVDILNMSLWSPGEIIWNSTCTAVAELVTAGIVPVIAAGNANTNASEFVPAACGYGIIVWAVDKNSQRGDFSNYGSIVDISAPWVGIYSARHGGGYISFNGTSMAAPHIAGLVSIIHAVLGQQSVDAVKALLLDESTEPTYAPGKPVGKIVNIPHLMESLGVTWGEGLCEAGQIWDGVSCVGEFTADLTQPLLSNRSEWLILKVWTTKGIKVWDGAGTYGATRNDPSMVGYGTLKSAGEGVFIASTDATFEQWNDVLPAEPIIESDDADLEVDESEMIYLWTFEEQEDVLPEWISIASAKQNPYRFRLVGLEAWETSVTIHDIDGREVVVPITIEPRVLKLNNAKKKKWIKWVADRWKITDISGYDDEVLAVKYMGDWKWRLKGLTDAITTITVEVYNEVEQRIDTMEYTLLIWEAQLPTYSYTDRGVCTNTEDVCSDTGTQTREMIETSCIGEVCDEVVTIDQQACERVLPSECFIASQDELTVDVWSTVILDIAGWAGSYRISKDNEGVGFGDAWGWVAVASDDETSGVIQIEQWDNVYEPGEDDACTQECEEERISIASDNGLFQEQGSVGIASDDNVQSIKILGLKPGTTVLTVTDAVWHKKEVTVTVDETVYWIQPNAWHYTPNKDNFWYVMNRQYHEVPPGLLDRFSYYRNGIFKMNADENADGEWPMMRTVYNNYEKKLQKMYWNLRASPTRERLLFEVSIDSTIELEAWSSSYFNVRWWLPRYNISHSTDAIRLSYVRHALTSPQKTDFVKWDSDDIIEVQDSAYDHEWDDEYDSMQDESWDTTITDEWWVGVAYDWRNYKTQNKSIEIHALVPWESFITIKDQTWAVRQIRVIVKEKIVDLSVWGWGWRYYRRITRQDFYVHSIVSSNPDIVSAFRDGKSYEYRVLQPGKAVITAMVSRDERWVRKPMQLTVITPSDIPLQVSQNQVTVNVGESVDVELSGGLPKYIFSKSNDLIGLWSQNQTTAIGVAWDDLQWEIVELNYIVSEWDDIYEPYDQDDDSTTYIVVDWESMAVEWWEEEFDEIEIAWWSPPDPKPNTLSVIGLQPGVSTVSISDELWGTVTFDVEVLPVTKEYYTVHDIWSVSHLTKIWYRAKFIDGWKYDRYNPLYRVERVTSGNQRILYPYFKQFRGRYGKWWIWWTTTMYRQVYLPLEKKKGTMIFNVEVDGPTQEEVDEHAREVAKYRARFSGPVSSINPGWGSSSNGGGGSSNNGSSSSSDDTYFESREITVSVWEKIEIPMKNWKSSYSLRLEDDKILYLWWTRGWVSVANDEELFELDVAYAWDNASIIEPDESGVEVTADTYSQTVNIWWAREWETEVYAYGAWWVKETLKVTVVPKTVPVSVWKWSFPLPDGFDIREISSSNPDVFWILDVNLKWERLLIYNAQQPWVWSFSMEVYDELSKKIKSVLINLEVRENYTSSENWDDVWYNTKDIENYSAVWYSHDITKDSDIETLINEKHWISDISFNRTQYSDDYFTACTVVNQKSSCVSYPRSQIIIASTDTIWIASLWVILPIPFLDEIDYNSNLSRQSSIHLAIWLTSNLLDDIDVIVIRDVKAWRRWKNLESLVNDPAQVVEWCQQLPLGQVMEYAYTELGEIDRDNVDWAEIGDTTTSILREIWEWIKEDPISLAPFIWDGKDIYEYLDELEEWDDIDKCVSTAFIGLGFVPAVTSKATKPIKKRVKSKILLALPSPTRWLDGRITDLVKRYDGTILWDFTIKHILKGHINGSSVQWVHFKSAIKNSW